MTKRNEPAKITIANLQREVRNLTQRCTDLVSARDSEFRLRVDNGNQVAAYSRKVSELESEVKQLRASVDYANNELRYCNGYIARVKETDATFRPGD